MIACPECGKEYCSISEFSQVRSIGLALVGLCKCGKWLSVSSLWRCIKRIEQNERKERSESAQGARRFAQLTMF